MDERTRAELVKQGVKAFQALTDWFENGHEPSAGEIKLLTDLRLIDHAGLTPEGKKMLVRLLTPDASALPGVRVFVPDSRGDYSEVDPSSLGKAEGHPKAPTLDRLLRFERDVRETISKKIASGVCPACEGRRLVITKFGPAVCDKCGGSGRA
jgi:hypothetical protein